MKDVGWIVRFKFRGASYELLTVYREPAWFGLLERRRGILARIFHAPPKPVAFDALRLIDEVLSSSGLISDIRWHYDEPDDFVSASWPSQPD